MTLDEYVRSIMTVSADVIDRVAADSVFQVAVFAFTHGAVPLGVAGYHCSTQVRQHAKEPSDFAVMDAVRLAALDTPQLLNFRQLHPDRLLSNFAGGVEQIKSEVPSPPPTHLLEAIGAFGIGDWRRDVYRISIEGWELQAYIEDQLPTLMKNPTSTDETFLACAASWNSFDDGMPFDELLNRNTTSPEGILFPEIDDPNIHPILRGSRQAIAARTVIKRHLLDRPSLVSDLRARFPQFFPKSS